jgi:opacity protein-like surface antigen
MKVKCIGLVGLIFIFTMIPSIGAAEWKGLYAEIKGTSSYQDISDPTIKYPSQNFGFSDKDDWAIGGGLAIGYDFDKSFSFPLRVELEYMIRDDAEVAWRGDQGIFISGTFDWELKAETQVDTILVNFFYDFKNSTAWTPFVTAGFGMSFIDWKSSYTDTIATPNISMKDDTTEFAWTVGFGCSYRLTEALLVDAGYRYLYAGTAEADYQTLTAESDIRLHEVVFGLRYAF